METTIGICYLGQHVKNGGYILLQFGRDKLLFLLIAPAVTIPREKFEADGISFVLSHLGNPVNVKRGELHQSQKIPNEELLKIKRNHLLAEVSLMKDDVVEKLRIVPLHGRRGFQFDINSDEVKLLPLPMANGEFISYLKTTFEIAS